MKDRLGTFGPSVVRRLPGMLSRGYLGPIAALIPRSVGRRP